MTLFAEGNRSREAGDAGTDNDHIQRLIRCLSHYMQYFRKVLTSVIWILGPFTLQQLTIKITDPTSRSVF